MLTGTKVRLVPLERRDLEASRQWVNDAKTQELMLRVLPVTESDQEKWFEENARNPSRMVFAIRMRTKDRHIGNAGLYHIDWVHRRAELWVLIGEPAFRRKGIGTEAVHLMLEYAFNGLNLHRLYLHVDERNCAAAALYLKTGFVREGLLREHYFICGTHRNVLVMGLTRGEYRGQK